MQKAYWINTRTSSLVSSFHNGYEYTQVREGQQETLIQQSPLDIVEACFLRTGSDLDGAIKSARFILKKKYKTPVALSARKNILLIKCPLANQDGTAWLVASHIDDIEPYGENQTIVYMAGGYSLIVAMKADKFQTKRTQATFLRSALLDYDRDPEPIAC